MKPICVPLLLGVAMASVLFASEETKTTAIDPTAGRVPFPKDYATAFEEVRASNKTGPVKLGTIYANAPAATVKDITKLPYPEGSVIVMEWAEPLKGTAGELILDANGNWKKGAVTRVDVMRRQKGFGQTYGEKRAGEWEFASYAADGSPFSPTPNFVSCAECHAKAAPRDFVFRGRFPAMENN